MVTLDLETEDLNYRSKFWRAYVLAILLTVVVSILVGLYAESIWLGVLSYFVINMITSIIVIYKFSNGQLKL